MPVISAYRRQRTGKRVRMRRVKLARVITARALSSATQTPKSIAARQPTIGVATSGRLAVKMAPVSLAIPQLRKIMKLCVPLADGSGRLVPIHRGRLPIAVVEINIVWLNMELTILG